jgi:flagellar biosynthesis/type III secretory pathway protein FliH
MKLFNLNKAVLAVAVGLIALVGTSQVAQAQSSRDWRKAQKRADKIEKRYEKAQRRADRQYYRVYRNGSYYRTDNRGAELLRQAVNQGYQQGYQAGQSDRYNRRNRGYNGSGIYRSGIYGYQSYVDRNQYQYYFREGFQRGYQDGYNSQSRYGYNSGGTLNILGSILSSILNIQPY